MAFNADEFKDDADFISFIKTTTEAAATEAATAAVTDLKSKNEEILGEKKKLQDMLSKYGDLDMDEAKKAMEFLSKNETAKLIADGKFDEVLGSHTEKIKAEYQEKIDALTEERNNIAQERDTHKSRFERSIVDAEVRKLAVKEGVLPEALEDVLFRAGQIFSYGEDGSVEARNSKGELLKVDDKLVTLSTWIKTLPRHYWPVSEGAGATGGRGSDIDERLASAAASGDHAAYRKMRKNKK